MSNSTNPKVDAIIANESKWQDEFTILREIILEFPLTEDVKWGTPCYTFNNGNVLLIHGFKDYCAILFIKGALLSDPNKILFQQTTNVQAGRQIRFTNTQEIIDLQATLKSYINEAIEIEKAGLKVELKTTNDYTIPEELQRKFASDLAFKAAFEKLTPGRQRAYILFFSQPKQSATRESRIAKNVEKIMLGKGLND